MKKIDVQSKSHLTAKTNDIILRENNIYRLIFEPLLVKNENDPNASIKGNFIFQRKGINDTWEDHKELNLTNLRAKEWIELELHSSEVLELFKNLDSLYKLFNQEGIPPGDAQFIQTNIGFGKLLAVDKYQFADLLDSDLNDTSDLITRLLEWVANIKSSEKILSLLDSADLQNLQSIAGLSTLKNCLSIWNENIENSNEEYWQNFFAENSYVLSQIFAHPVIIIEDKAYVGGTGISRKGGKIVDFIAQNKISKNTSLIEIKTPMTPLLGSKYRDNVFNVSRDITGALIQVSNYKDKLQKRFHVIRADSETEFELFEPQSIVIAGNFSKEIGSDNTKKKSFELFRSNLNNIQIITFDELFEKIKFMVSLLEGNLDIDIESELIEEDEIPF